MNAPSGRIPIRSHYTHALYEAVFGERWSPRRLAACLLVVLGLYAFSRAPFFLSCPLPIVPPDASSYFPPVRRLESGQAPTFEYRSPGFPLFWWLCRRFSPRALAVVYAQAAVTVATLTGVLVLLARHAPPLLVPATFALAVFVSGPIHLALEVSLLSDALFADATMTALTAMFLALKTRRPAWAATASLAAGLATLVRPTGVVLLPLLAVAAAYALLFRMGRRLALALVLPVAAPLLGLAAYNFATLGVFELLPSRLLARLAAPSVYIEPDPALPAEINQAIAEKDARIPAKDREIIYHSRDLGRVRHTIYRHIWHAVQSLSAALHTSTGDPLRDIRNRPLLDAVLQTAWRQHPEVRWRLAAATFRHYFALIDRSEWLDFYSYWPGIQYRETFLEPAGGVESVRDAYPEPRPPGFTVERENGELVVNPPWTPLMRLYCGFAEMRRRCFVQTVWVLPVPLALLWGLYRSVRSRGASLGGGFTLLLVAGLVGQALLVGLVGWVEKRYSWSLEYLNYFFLAVGVQQVAAWEVARARGRAADDAARAGAGRDA